MGLKQLPQIAGDASAAGGLGGLVHVLFSC